MNDIEKRRRLKELESLYEYEIALEIGNEEYKKDTAEEKLQILMLFDLNKKIYELVNDFISERDFDTVSFGLVSTTLAHTVAKIAFLGEDVHKEEFRLFLNNYFIERYKEFLKEVEDERRFGFFEKD